MSLEKWCIIIASPSFGGAAFAVGPFGSDGESAEGVVLVLLDWRRLESLGEEACGQQYMQDMNNVTRFEGVVERVAPWMAAAISDSTSAVQYVATS